MGEKTDDERVSIWSTGDKERIWFISLASAFFYISLILILWHKIIEVGYNTIIEVIDVIGSASLAAIALAFFIIEGVNLMIVPVEKYRRKLRQESRQEGRQEGRREERQKIFKAIESAYPEVDIEIIRAALEDQNRSSENSK